MNPFLPHLSPKGRIANSNNFLGDLWKTNPSIFLCFRSSMDLDFIFCCQRVKHEIASLLIFILACRNHRGLRHYWGLRVRGQHTKTTGRRGKTVGVSKKRWAFTSFFFCFFKNEIYYFFVKADKILFWEWIWILLHLNVDCDWVGWSYLFYLLILCLFGPFCGGYHIDFH